MKGNDRRVLERKVEMRRLSGEEEERGVIEANVITQLIW